MLTAARALAASCVALTLTGCAAAVSPTTPAAAVTPTASTTSTLSGEKAASGAKPPAAVDGWTLARSQDSAGGAKQYLYARPGDAKASLIVTVSPVALTADALATVLTAPQSFGPATCGSLAGGTVACYAPLSGGNLSVTAPLSVAELGAVAQHLYAALP